MCLLDIDSWSLNVAGDAQPGSDPRLTEEVLISVRCQPSLSRKDPKEAIKEIGLWQKVALLKLWSLTTSKSIEDYSDSKYLAKSDVPEPVELTIDHMTDEVMQDGKVKACAHWRESDVKSAGIAVMGKLQPVCLVSVVIHWFFTPMW